MKKPKKLADGPPPAAPKKRTKAEVLEDMHTALADTLLQKVKSGDVDAATLNVARAFLKDNGIEGNLDNSEPLKELTAVLPFAPTGTCK